MEGGLIDEADVKSHLQDPFTVIVNCVVLASSSNLNHILLLLLLF